MDSAQAVGTEQLLADYEEFGYKLVKVNRKLKKPTYDEWQLKTIPPDEMREWVSSGGNVGIQAGAASDWICGIDLDCREAQLLGAKFLPETLKLKKGDEPPSVYVYRVPELGYAQFNDLDENRLIDIIASNDGAGHQFTVPPSIHPNKGAYIWVGGFNPAAIAQKGKEEIQVAVGQLAVCTLLARILPDTGRHDFGLELAGYLLRNGVPPERVLLILQEAWKLNNAPGEAFRDLEGIVASTKDKLERGEHVKGGRSLGERFSKLPRRIAKFLGWTQTDNSEAPTSGAGVKDELEDLPTEASLHMPPGYEIDHQGVYRVSYKARGEEVEKIREQITHAPLLISARTSDIHDGSESTTLLYKRGSEYRERTEPRAVIASAREITRTAAHGVPVTSNTASRVVEYLAVFEAYNLERLPHTRTARQLGWLGDSGKSGFLVGHELIGGAGTIEFRGADDGDEQIAAGFSRRGTHKGWFEAIEELAPYPRVYMALYGSLAPPVLAIVGAPNFGIDWSNPTSTGKTTTLRVGASCWGSSDERSPEKVLHSWDSTRVWIERAAGVLNCLPLILDESKRARYPRAVSQTLYDVANGSGRGRGTPRGLARAGAWTTVLLSTGESPVTSFSEDGGTRARMISLWGPPFGGADEKTAAVVTTLRHALDTHYGHAGPLFVEYLAANREAWGEYREGYRELKTKYAIFAGDESVLGRLGEYFAALALTAALAERAEVMPVFEDPVARLWDALKATSQEADRALLALDMVVSWMHSHQSEFYGRHRSDPDDVPIQPSSGWAGRWVRGADWEDVAFLPDRLREILRRLDYEPDSVLRAWRDRGWLSTDKDRKRMQQRMRLAGERPYMYVIKREAFDEEARSDVD
jgi:uncharacterized protein (DUF927 family)